MTMTSLFEKCEFQSDIVLCSCTSVSNFFLWRIKGDHRVFSGLDSKWQIELRLEGFLKLVTLKNNYFYKPCIWCLFSCVPCSACVGQRTTSGVGPSLPPCLTQGLLSAAARTRLPHYRSLRTMKYPTAASFMWVLEIWTQVLMFFAWQAFYQLSPAPQILTQFLWGLVLLLIQNDSKHPRSHWCWATVWLLSSRYTAHVAWGEKSIYCF